MHVAKTYFRLRLGKNQILAIGVSAFCLHDSRSQNSAWTKQLSEKHMLFALL
jgi:hypothetical protein